ncbi:hypothetical protein HRG_008254 [Hirsutella rhossiliensis]|uniref:Uncharacterized protein n=1 Tax=Hirsutella rhossiliensis TaxID=111463 RepID=A0A9P8SHJ7_9HYPO|nr:uncharacterized protein HRG_08254 [Hirsutella rhossiliensis]KAH0961101.1 hypothetical protein HRG_08254 [Hirsutella rhossiliensis]
MALSDEDVPGDEEAVVSHDAPLESSAQLGIAASPYSPTSLAAVDTANDEHVDSPPAATPAPDVTRKQSSTAARAVALELYNLHTPMHVITQRTGIKSGAFYALIRRATQRGFTRGSRVLDEHVVDGHRSGRPQTAERGRDGKRKRRRKAAEADKAGGDDGTGESVPTPG